MLSLSARSLGLVALFAVLPACGAAGVTALNQTGAAGQSTAGIAAQPAGDANENGAAAAAQTGGNVSATKPVAAAAGTLVGFEYVPGSASAALHPASDTAFWSANAQALQALVPSSTPAARLVVGTYDSSEGKVTLAFARPASSTLKASSALAYSSSDTFEAMLSKFDATGVQAVLEVAIGYNEPDELADAVLAAYGSHKSVVALSFDLSTDKGDSLSSEAAGALAASVLSRRAGTSLQLRATQADLLPAGVANVTYVLDTAGKTTVAGIGQAVQAFAQALPGATIDVVVGQSSQRAAVCAQTGPQAALLSAALNASSSVKGVFWSSETAAQLSPGTGFACPATAATTTTTGGTGAAVGTSTSAGTGTAAGTATGTVSGTVTTGTGGAAVVTGAGTATATGTATGTGSAVGATNGAGIAANTNAGTGAANGTGTSTAMGNGTGAASGNGTGTGTAATGSTATGTDTASTANDGTKADSQAGSSANSGAAATNAGKGTTKGDTAA